MPLPPLAEQEAIVARVEELMHKIEQLEQQANAKIQLTQHLGTAALQQLTAAAPEDLPRHWHFLKQHFHTLFGEEQNVKKLRETIFQLAVQGKLTAAWRKNHRYIMPASELLKEIQAEKKKRGRSERYASVKDKEKAFAIPENWLWVRFGELSINRDSERIPLSKEERQHRKGNYDYYGASGVIDHIDDFLFDKDLLLIGEDGANLINRSTPIAFIAKGRYWVNNHAHVIDAINFDMLKYLEIYVNSISLVPYITGMAQPKMNQKYMNSIPVAMPPLQEQTVIIGMVKELMAQCDDLDMQIQKYKQEEGMVMQAVVQEVLEVQTQLIQHS